MISTRSVDEQRVSFALFSEINAPEYFRSDDDDDDDVVFIQGIQ